MRIEDQKSYFVVNCTLRFGSFAEAASTAPDDIAAHIQRSKELHATGSLLMSGAFLETGAGSLTTMAVTTSRAAAEEYIQDDPFFLKGMIAEWRIQEWANMFAS